MLSGDSTYWLLYEGTPGGLLEVGTDIVVTSNGSQVLASQSWIGDIPGDEWAYFGDPTVNRSFFMAHHNADDAFDSYRPMDNLMTVFGFGRERAFSYMTDFPAQLTVGLVEGIDFPHDVGGDQRCLQGSGGDARCRRGEHAARNAGTA